MTHTPDLTFARWSALDIAREADAAIAAKAAALAAVKDVPASGRTFTNTIAALEHADEPFSEREQIFQFLMNVHPDTAIRAAAQEASARMDEENIRMEYDRGIYDVVMAWERTGERERLSGPDRKLADDTLRDLRRMGFGLPDGQFEELKSIHAKLKRLEDAFERAINDWDDGMLVTESQLDGLPDSYREGLTRTDDGRFRISLQYPDLHPFMRLAHDDDARRALATKNLRKGGPENLERLTEMVRLRQRAAALLGYPTHADFVIEPRMAKTGIAAAEFIRSLITKLISAARIELRDLIALKKETLGLAQPTPIGFHEIAYWSERLRRQRYGLDTETIRSYLSLERVLTGMMDVYQELFHLRFTRLPNTATWHSETEVYAVTDQIDGTFLGAFILDLHPRTGKYGHAAMFPIRLGQHPLVALVCNFPRATAARPALLSHEETETLFHEFGHLIHALVSARRPYVSQNGMAVALDFVEAPSQMLEEWAWHPAVLRRISAHHTTREPLSDDLIQKMLDARHHLDANYYLAQAVMALYDLRMHGQPTDVVITASDIAHWHREMELEYRAIEVPDDAIQAAGWSHLADYDAGYYGYLWSKVSALDLFTRFAGDPLDATVGSAYRQTVLEPGASQPERELIQAFLGRENSDAAFYAALGIG